jgi:NCS1 family nucleobase:cation symporter-1
VTTLNILPKAKERTIVLWVGLVSTALALVFPIDQYENFLYLLGAVFTPLFGVVLADYFALRRKGIIQEALYATEGSYWYWGGINWVAIGSWAVGFFAYQMAVKWDLVVGATAPALVVTATIYLLAMKLLYKQKNGQLKTHVA